MLGHLSRFFELNSDNCFNRPMGGWVVLRVSELTKGFGSGSNRLEVLKGIDLEIQPGELVASLGRLDEALKDPKLQLHPRLRHFLENRSYEKALLWLDDGVPEKGVCGA